MNYTKENKITFEEIDWLEKNWSTLYRKSKLFSRLPDTLRYRLLGKTLSEIGKIYEVTSDRIRQIEAKAVEIIINRR